MNTSAIRVCLRVQNENIKENIIRSQEIWEEISQMDGADFSKLDASHGFWKW